AVNSEIASLETSIEDLRLQLTETTGSGNSLASKTTELRAAEENYQFQIALVQQALTMMETARLEANRQVRYLSLGVVPIAPDDPTYPKAFENTLVSFLIFAGIYLMFSLTASILREQVSS
ncbi:MAG: capsule biosynthesis protein, partial [Marivivens sp.]|nr:capsule biosynthesis protein [Marivivens sp.]